MNGAKAAGLILVICGILVLRQIVGQQQAQPNADEQAAAKAAAEKKAAAERVERLAGRVTWLSNNPDENFSIAFPNKPTPQIIHLVGLNPTYEKSWHLSWFYHTEFDAHFHRADDYVTRDDETVPYDRCFVNQTMKRTVSHHNNGFKGTPGEWKVIAQREFTVGEKYAAIEFIYTYRVAFNETGVIKPGPIQLTEYERRARVWIVKVPKAYYYLTVGGEPDVVTSPLADTFFNSFAYMPAN
jgi:hypothetical protein